MVFGVAKEISDGKVLEMLCADKLAEPDANLSWAINLHRSWTAIQNTESWRDFVESCPEDAGSLSNMLDKISDLALQQVGVAGA